MHQPQPTLQQIPASIAAVADYEPFARERMSGRRFHIHGNTVVY